jgi:hypothetical protein
MIVKFPYSNNYIKIQIIFDFLNNSKPPDFIIIDENNNNFLLDYFYISNDWNFKESSSLYFSLLKIKNSFTKLQNKRLIQEIEKNLKSSEENSNFDMNMNNDSNMNMNFNGNENNEYNNDIRYLWQFIKSIHNRVVKKIQNYTYMNSNLNLNQNEKLINVSKQSNLSNSNTSKSEVLKNNINFFISSPTKSQSLTVPEKSNSFFINNLRKEIELINIEAVKEKLPEIYFSYNTNKNNIDYIDYKNFLIISYPLDIEFNSKNLIKYPYIDIRIFLNFDLKFQMDFHVPEFIETNLSRNKEEKYDIKEYEFYLERFEKSVYGYLKDYSFREKVIKNIIELNLGFTLEIDSSSYRSLSQCLYIKEQINLDLKYSRNNFNSSISSKNNSNSNKNNYKNILIKYSFDRKDENIFNINLIDTDEMVSINTKKINYSNSNSNSNFNNNSNSNSNSNNNNNTNSYYNKSEKEINHIINGVLEFVINNI